MISHDDDEHRRVAPPRSSAQVTSPVATSHGPSGVASMAS